MGNITKKPNGIFARISKPVWLIIAGMCAVALVLITVFSARYIMDCVTAEKTITFTERNGISHVLHTTEGNGFYPDELKNHYSHYRRYYTEDIDAVSTYSVETSKPIALTYKAVYSAELKVRMSGNGSNGVFWDWKDSALPTKTGDCVFVGGKAVINETFPLDIEKFEAKLTEYINDSNPRVTNYIAEIVFTAEYQLTAKDNSLKTAPYARSMAIQLEKELFQITYNGGKDTVQADIPERNIRLPDFWVSVVIVVGIAAALVLLVGSLKGAFKDKDEFRGIFNKIMRKYYNEVALAAASEKPAFCGKVVSVESFEELLKFSFSLYKPVTCYKTDNSALFSIVCDDVHYQYVIKR
ncbi:MAG: DUF5305 domain-containing protein [Firmicutes bacterium]|nr:DUF5305 domain-containing protein [Bacillota bacterium]